MARISLNCACGWNFFIPGSTPGHEVTCPSCQQTVRIPGRVPGKDVPTSAGGIAYEIQRKQRNIKLFIGIGVVGVIAGITIFAFSGGSKPPDDLVKEDDGGKKATRDSKAGAQKSKGLIGDLPPVELPPPPKEKDNRLYNDAQIAELKHGVYENVWLINMTSILSEVMRYRNLTEYQAQFQTDINTYGARLKKNLAELAKVDEKVQLDAYFEPGDQILGFAQRDFASLRPGEAAQVLHGWVNSWRAGPQMERADVVRGDKRLVIYVSFPEDTKELLNLARHPALGIAFVDNGGGGNIGPIGDIVAVPTELLKDIETRFAALFPGYKDVMNPEDRTRLDKLARDKKGSSADIDWLKTKVLNEIIPGFQREMDMVRSKMLELESKLKETIAVDRIIRKNGTYVDGQIVEETETQVKIKTRIGTAPIGKEEISKVDKGGGAGAKFPKDYEAAKGNIEALIKLIDACRQSGLKLEKEYACYTIITLAAGNTRARTELLLPKPAFVPGTGPGPGPKSISPANDGSGAKVDAIYRTIDIIASDVTSRITGFHDVVAEMRRRTESMTTATIPVPPEKSAKGTHLIQNPLTFKSSDLSVPASIEIGTWWNGLSVDDRREFAKYFGLWCAYTRQMNPPAKK